MRRRQLLCGVGVVGGCVVSGVGLGTVAAASSVTEFTVSDAHVETATNELEDLWIRQIQVEASWSGFDAPAALVEMALDITYEDETIEDASTHQIELAGDEYEGTVESQLPSVDLVSTFESQTFEIRDGGPETFDFSFTLRLMVHDTAGRTVTTESTDAATAIVTHKSDDVVDVLGNIVITTDGTTATIFNGSDEDVCVTLRWRHSGHGEEETQTFVQSDEAVQQEPPGGAPGAPSYDIEAVGYELGGC